MSQLLARNQRLGPYRILQKIGSGGFGAVYKAEDTRNGASVALKIPHHQDRGPEYLTHEPSVLSKLDHPNIVRFIEATRVDDLFFFVMEFIDGESLSNRLDRDRQIPWQEAADIIRQVAEAVGFAHRMKVLHRDLRPANILIRDDGIVKVTDFGIAKALVDTEYAHTIIGSPPYMAPEQLEGRATFASDLYSLGVIFYEAVTGMLPYYDVNFASLRQKILTGKCPTPQQLNPEVPLAISQFIMRAMHRFRDQRFQNAEEFLQGLHMAVSGSGARQKAAEQLPRSHARVRTPSRRSCWNCFRPVHPRAKICPACGEHLM